MTRIGSISITLLTMLSLIAAGLPGLQQFGRHTGRNVDLQDVIVQIQEALGESNSQQDCLDNLAHAVRAMRVIVGYDTCLRITPISDLSLITPQVKIPFHFYELSPLLPFQNTGIFVELISCALQWVECSPPDRPPALLCV
jgi:hypothetical protein